MNVLRKEEVLCSVFGYACDLIQNAVEIAEECEDRHVNPQDYGSPTETNTKWRVVEDAEREQIRIQRKERQHHSTPDGSRTAPLHCNTSPANEGWSQRILTGEQRLWCKLAGVG